MIHVVGSGPAGTAAAVALVERGLPVTMLDAGLDLEPERRALVERMGRQRPEEWSDDDLRALKGPTRVKWGGVERKLAYGSDYPYRQPGPAGEGDAGRRSFALGGLSTVWGGAVLPYRAADLLDWPVAAGDLDRHTEAVLSFVDRAFAVDDLADLFPLHTPDARPIAPSRQAEALLADAARHRAVLLREGLHVGRARLAVRSGDDGCVRCGLCLYGCPYGFIYSTRATVEALRRRPGFTYRPGVIVEEVHDDAGGVRIVLRRLADGGLEEARGEAVFLGCGPLSTAEILLRSRRAHDRELRLRGHDYFVVPFVRRAATPDVRDERLHTLAQVFLEAVDPATGETTAHLQFYTYNDLYDRLIGEILGPVAVLLRRPLDSLLGRLMIIQGVVRAGSEVSIRLPAGGGLHLERRRSDARRALGPLLAKIRRARRALGGVVIRPLLRWGPPGEGYYGGTLPMRERPAAWETDPLGRPGGAGRIHVVDASVFPSIPPTPITLPLMANAHRIASSYPP